MLKLLAKLLAKLWPAPTSNDESRDFVASKFIQCYSHNKTSEGEIELFVVCNDETSQIEHYLNCKFMGNGRFSAKKKTFLKGMSFFINSKSNYGI